MFDLPGPHDIGAKLRGVFTPLGTPLMVLHCQQGSERSPPPLSWEHFSSPILYYPRDG